MKRVLLIALLSICQFAFSQNRGTVTGLVTDKEMGGEPLPFANVFIKGTSIGSTTDMDGKYTIQAPVGNQIIVFSFVGYQTVEKPIVVKAGQTITVNQEVGASEGVALDEVEIKATVNKERESALLLEQKKAVAIQTKIGAQELSRKGVSDAQGAVTKVSGISKQEGIKNVFVRGLGDRYNTTSLNGFPIPSEDPEYKNISLDFFGTGVIKNIGVSKVFSSNTSGDVGGANINIASKELSGGSEFTVDISGGANTEILKSDFYEQDGVSYFGISNSKESGVDIQKFNFQNKLNPTLNESPYNHGFGISGGKRFDFEDESRLSLFFVGSHSTGFSYADQVINKTTTDGTIYAGYKGKKSSKNISQIGLFNLLYKFNRHKIAYNFMIVHGNSQYVGDYKGYDNGRYEGAVGDRGFTKRQQNNDNTLMVNQIISNWKLSDVLDLEAGISYSKVKGLEPDRRTNTFSKREEKDKYITTAGENSHVRNFLTLDKNDYNAKLSFSYKLNNSDEDDMVSKITFGYDGRIVIDDFKAVEYTLKGLGEIVELSGLNLDALYNKANLDNGEFEMDRNFDLYDVNKKIHAGFVDFVYQISNNFIANVGVRFDDVNLPINYNVERGGNKGTSKIKKSYFLPSVNLKYSTSEKSSFRLGSSITYTLPQSKEISPYKYVAMDFESQGNPNLKPSDNYNLDLKWEYFMTPSELFSLTGFYKYIKSPIARISIGNSAGILFYDNISDKADVLGLELEFRKHLLNSDSDDDYEGNNSYKLTAGLNASYIHSNLEIEKGKEHQRQSELEGSAPILVNTDLTYNFTKNERSFTNSLVLNYFSDRIYTIGTLGFNDIVEKGIIGLDFVSSSQLTKNLTLKIKAKNLLNPTYELSRNSEAGDKIILRTYKKGIDLGLGLSYKF